VEENTSEKRKRLKFDIMESVLKILFLIAVVWIVLCQLVPKLKNELNSQGIISLFYQLEIAYIIGFGFYFLTVSIPERKNTKNINAYVIPRTKNIIGDGYGVFNELAKKGGVSNLKFPPTNEQLQNILKKVNPQISDAPMVTFDLHNIGWIQYLNNMRLRSQGFIKKIIDRMPFLNTDLLRLLTQIDDNSYFHYIESITYPLQNKDLTFLSGVLLSYFNDINDLEKFMEREYNENTRYNDLFLTH
jgi:hypothetical protein